MSDYSDTVLADSPILYYRLDQLGMGVDGETVIDLSGNGLDGTLGYEAQVGIGPALPNSPSWGHASPIETDAASREFWGWTNATVYGFTGTSYIEIPSDSLMQPAPKDFTVEEWLRPMANIPLASNFPMAHKEGTGGVLLTFAGGGTRIGGFCYDSEGTLFTVYDPSFFVTDHLEESFHVVVVRNGDALALYVNGTLRGTATVTSGLPTRFTGDPFHVHPASLAYTNARHDEVAYYDYALNASRILAHYEAALNVLNMRGECNIRTSAILSGSDEPDAAEYSFRHNWTQPVVERFRWRTGVFTPTDGPTQLARQRSSLRRQVEYQHLLYSDKLRRQFEARAFGGRTALVQFEPDKVQVDALLSGATTAQIDTRYRDFQAGQQVLIYENDDKYEFRTLTAVTDDAIEWSEGLSQSYTRPWIKPARVARLPTTSEVELHNDVVGGSSTIYEYLEEDEPLFPRRIIPFSPTLIYHARDVFDLREWQGHDYSELPKIEYVADRSLLDDSTGVVSEKQYRWGAQVAQSYNMNLEGRELIAKYLGWIHERAGQYQPFWMPTFKQDLRPLSRSGNVLLIEGHEYSDYYANADNRADLAFVYFDNTTQLRRIQSFNVDGDNDALSLDSSTPTLTGLRWLSFLRRVILSSDDMEIAWHTDDTVRVAFAVIDAPMDTALGSPSVSPSPSASISHSVSPSASSSRSLSPSSSLSPSTSISPTLSPSSSPSQSSSPSLSPSSSASPSV